MALHGLALRGMESRRLFPGSSTNLAVKSQEI